MDTNKIKTYSLAQIKDELIGKEGTPTRDEYEFELKLELLGEMIKTARQQRNLTQEQLGDLVGVQKAQISKLERNANNVTVETILKVFKALKANVSFKVALVDKEVSLT
ncbi:helix-turn-helix domain-containing protein [Spirosoma soli]|uniref:Helix-turn-helix domain-containing protein n=1 Tax=Spirosoma soli TaxID=1770529 RepID=A0ABW5M0Z4_9BACT